MLRNVFLKTLRDQRRSLVWWIAGVAALAVFTMLFYPSVADVPEINKFFEEMPEALARSFMGDVADYTSPEGYLNAEMFGFTIPLLFLVFNVGRGAGAVAGEEEKGTLELLLSYPLLRRKLIEDKFLAMLVVTIVITIAIWVSALVGAAIVDMDIGVWSLAQITVSAALLGLVFGAFSLALGSATGRKNTTIGITSSLALAAYLLNALAPLVDWLEPARRFSPFYYYNAADPLSNGLNLGHVAVLTGLVAAFVAVALFSFGRRDLTI